MSNSENAQLLGSFSVVLNNVLDLRNEASNLKKIRQMNNRYVKKGVVDETAPFFLADYTKKARYKPDFKNIKEIGHTGFEPVNYGFRVHCLTNLANAQ